MTNPNASLASILALVGILSLPGCEPADEPPAGCNATQFAEYEAVVSSGDGAGHGPDVGSLEWKHVVSRKLGVVLPGDEDSAGSTNAWCAKVETALSGVHLLGYRDILFGDAIAQHDEIDLGDPVVGECQYGHLPAAEGIRFMIVNGAVTRIDVSGSDTLPNGLGVGSAASQIQAEYNDRLRVVPNKYDDTADDYIVKLLGDIRILLEVSGGQVVRYRVGRLPEVEWVEGCL